MAEYKKVFCNLKCDYLIVDKFYNKDNFLKDNRFDYLLENVPIRKNAR